MFGIAHIVAADLAPDGDGAPGSFYPPGRRRHLSPASVGRLHLSDPGASTKEEDLASAAWAGEQADIRVPERVFKTLKNPAAHLSSRRINP
jgi:hypothetical protein